MKLEATIVLSYRADSLAEAGSALDDVLRRAYERADVEVESVQLNTPTTSGPVSLPAVAPPPPVPARVPRPPSSDTGANGGNDTAL
jgi:hypothetical protein